MKRLISWLLVAVLALGGSTALAEDTNEFDYKMVIGAMEQSTGVDLSGLLVPHESVEEQTTSREVLIDDTTSMVATVDEAGHLVNLRLIMLADDWFPYDLEHEQEILDVLRKIVICAVFAEDLQNDDGEELALRAFQIREQLWDDHKEIL